MDRIEFDGILIDVETVRQKLAEYENPPMPDFYASNAAQVAVKDRNSFGCFLSWGKDYSDQWHWTPKALREFIDWLIKLEELERRRLERKRS